MFTEKFLKEAWALTQARLKHSDLKSDWDKCKEELEEFYAQNLVSPEETEIMQEFTDLIISAFGCMMHKLEPKSLEELSCINQLLGEENEHKSDRTIKRFEEGYYK